MYVEKEVLTKNLGTKTKMKNPDSLSKMRENLTLLDPKSERVKEIVRGVPFRRLEIDTTGKGVEESVEEILGALRCLN